MMHTENHEKENPEEIQQEGFPAPEENIPLQTSEETKPAEATKAKMSRKNKVILGAAVLAVAAVVFVLTQFVFVGGSMYSVKSESLDLRGVELMEEDFLDLSKKLPNCQITWDVPFQDSIVASNTAEITVTSLTEEDVRMLEYVTGLKRVNGADCEDYLRLAQLQENRPDVEVLYTVPIAGKVYAKNTQELKLDSFTEKDAQRLPALLQLHKVEISNCEDYALLQQLQTEYPQWNLTYTVRIGRQEVDWDVPVVQAENVTGEELALALSGLPELVEMDITNPAADHQTLFALREQYPNVELNWVVEYYGLTISEDATEVDFSGIPMESCEEAERLVACLPNLEKLIMSDCGIDNEAMAQFRERQRENYKVVWTVYLGNICVLRTDATSFMPYNQGEGYFYDEEAVDLKYCEDIICMDLGHHDITNIDFVKYMPHLKYLILAHTRIRDVSALVGCQELIYLEIDWSRVQDLSPLVELKALEDLNLSRTYCDLTPVLEMTWLKNLWVPNRSPEDQERLIESLPDTHLELNAVNTKGWRHLANYYAQRDILGMEYMNQ